MNDLNRADVIKLIAVTPGPLNLRGVNLSRVNLSWLDLTGANLTSADLTGVNLEGANLIGADLSRSILNGAKLSRARMKQVKIIGSTLNKASLIGADLTDGDLSGSDLSGADLKEATITGAKLKYVTAVRANFTGSDLTDADFYDSNLSAEHSGILGYYNTNKEQGANFSLANLSGVSFYRCDLRSAVFYQSVLCNTDFTDAWLYGSKFRWVTYKYADERGSGECRGIDEAIKAANEYREELIKGIKDKTLQPDEGEVLPTLEEVPDEVELITLKQEEELGGFLNNLLNGRDGRAGEPDDLPL